MRIKNMSVDPFKQNTSNGEQKAVPDPIDGDLLLAYNQTRRPECRDTLCHAPFKNMYFGHHGKVRSCCYNRQHIWGEYPGQSIKDIWIGAAAQSLRTYINNNDLSLGCESCSNHMEAKSFDGIKSKMYDELPLHDKYPTSIEFELSNACNLECIMCSGRFSSSIRANREKKSPIESPYDESFVDQLDEFIPHLHETKYYGGEPFLVELYYQIWDKTVSSNPNCRISVQTNATILNNRVKKLLEKGNFHLNISLDSLVKPNFEAIRVNAKFETVMENIHYFHEYCNTRNTFFGISACVMKQNWKEIPNFVPFCNQLNAPIYYHTVWHPKESALRFWSPEQLKEVHDYFKSFSFPDTTETEKKNKQHFSDLVRLIDSWCQTRIKDVKYQKSIIDLDVKSLQNIFVAKLEKLLIHASNGIDNMETNNMSKVKAVIESIVVKDALLKAFSKIEEIPIESITTALANDSIESIREKLMNIGEDD